MITQKKRKEIIEKTIEYFKKANIAITDKEKNSIETADFGLNEIETTGLEILIYVNTDRVCAKELVILPNQTCPEHRHPAVGGEPGKEETFKCRYGKVYLYVEGKETQNRKVNPPDAPKGSYTVFHEIELNPGEQYTLYPNTKHWFKSGEDGAVLSEFSTKSQDESDVFTDNRIIRVES